MLTQRVGYAMEVWSIENLLVKLAVIVIIVNRWSWGAGHMAMTCVIAWSIEVVVLIRISL